MITSCVCYRRFNPKCWPPAGVFQDAYILRPITVTVYYTIITCFTGFYLVLLDD